MGKKQFIYFIAMVFFAVFLLNLSIRDVSAMNSLSDGLVAMYPDWDGYAPQFPDNNSDFNRDIYYKAVYDDCLAIGWRSNGVVTPISLDNISDFTLKSADGEENEYSIVAKEYWTYDEEVGDDVSVIAGDGLFTPLLSSPGDYTLTYSGPETAGSSAYDCTASLHVILPPVGLYTENRVSEETFIESREIEYKVGDEYYLLPYNFDTGVWKQEVTNVRCKTDRPYDVVEFTPLNSGYKIKILDMREEDFGLQILFDIEDWTYDTASQTEYNFKLWDEDAGYTFLAAQKQGLVVTWPDEDENGPVFAPPYEKFRGWIDRRASYQDWISIGWADEDGNVTPISVDNLDDFSFTDSAGGETEYCFEPFGDWIYNEDVGEDVLVPYGNGIFNLGFYKPDTYTMTYSGPEAEGADEEACSVRMDCIMPWVGVYTKNEVSAENLVWIEDVPYKCGSEFYILTWTEEYDDRKKGAADLQCEWTGEKLGDLEEVSNGYKLTITEESDDRSSLLCSSEFQVNVYDEKSEEWVNIYSGEEERWVHFEPMEKYGLLVQYAPWEQDPETGDYELTFSADEEGSVIEDEIYGRMVLCLAWKDKTGNIEPIPLASVDQFKVYDEEGNEVKNCIAPEQHRNGETGEMQYAGDGIFLVHFNNLGKYRIEYEGESVSTDVDYMTDFITVKIGMPLVGVYSSEEVSEETLVPVDDETENIYYTDVERVFYLNPIEEVVEKAYKEEITLLPEKFEVRGEFEDGSDEWKDWLSFEKTENGNVKITVKAGTREWFDLTVCLLRKGYHWDFEQEKWICDDEWEEYVWHAFDCGLTDISHASVNGFSLSYGYSGKAYTPAFQVVLDGKTLVAGTDYTYKFKNNKDPGTATLTITGIGNYTGTRIKTFEIVDCVKTLVSGKTYQFIPKNNSSTAVCSFAGRMVNNTKVYITDRSNSEAMKFKAIKNADGSWKFINAKCELALAVQQNSSLAGKGLVLYDQTTRKAQNWNLIRKYDNSFAIVNAVSGLYVSMSDMSAPKGTLLTMNENSGRGDQRFYIAETTTVSAPFDGTYAVKASKDKTFGLNVASSSTADGANVNLYKYSNINAKKFKVIYSGGGYYRLVNVNSGLVLSVKGNTKTNGANVIQSKWAAQSGQRWKITKNSNGTVTLKNALGTVLHLNGNKTANGTNVVAKTASTSGAQKWYLE